jgi:hypothetical protein
MVSLALLEVEVVQTITTVLLAQTQPLAVMGVLD